MWCPKCNKEYEEGFTLCVKCGSKLIDYTPIIAEDAENADIFDIEEEESNTQENTAEDVIRELSGDYDENDALALNAYPQLLITVIGEDEADRIVKLLEDNLIPSMKKASEQETVQPETDFEADDEFLNLDILPDETDDFIDADDFSSESDETLESDEPLFDIFVPEAMYRDALKIIVEDEQNSQESTDNDIADSSENSADGNETADTESNDEPKKNSEHTKGGLIHSLFKHKKDE